MKKTMILSIDPVIFGFRFGSTQPTDLWDAVRSQFGSIDDGKIVMCILKRLMTLILNLPSQLEQYLLHEAREQGISIEAMTLRLLTNAIPTKQK